MKIESRPVTTLPERAEQSVRDVVGALNDAAQVGHAGARVFSRLADAQWSELAGAARAHPLVRRVVSVAAVLQHAQQLHVQAKERYGEFSLAHSAAVIAIESWLATAREQPGAARLLSADALHGRVEEALDKERSERIVRRPEFFNGTSWTVRHCANEPLRYDGQASEWVKRLLYGKTQTGDEIYLRLAGNINAIQGDLEAVQIDRIKDHQQCAYLTHNDSSDEWLALPTQLGDDALPTVVYQAGTGVEDIYWDRETGQYYAKILPHADDLFSPIEDVTVRMYLREHVTLRQPLTPAQFTRTWAGVDVQQEDFHPDSWALYEKYEQHRNKLSPGALANVRAQQLQWREYHYQSKAAFAALAVMGKSALKHFHEPPIEASNCVSSTIEQAALEHAFGGESLRFAGGWLGAKCDNDYHCALTDNLLHLWVEQWDGRHWMLDVNWRPPRSEAMARLAEAQIRHAPPVQESPAALAKYRIGHVQFVGNSEVQVPQATPPSLMLPMVITSIAVARHGARMEALGARVAPDVLAKAAIIPVQDAERSRQPVEMIVTHNGLPVYLPTSMVRPSDSGYGVPIPLDPSDQLGWDPRRELFILLPGSAASRQSRLVWNESVSMPQSRGAMPTLPAHAGKRGMPELHDILAKVRRYAPRYDVLHLSLSQADQLDIAYAAFEGTVRQMAAQQPGALLAAVRDTNITLNQMIAVSPVTQHHSASSVTALHFTQAAQMHGYRVFLAIGGAVELGGGSTQVWPTIKGSRAWTAKTRWWSVGSGEGHLAQKFAPLLLEPEVFTPHLPWIHAQRDLAWTVDPAARLAGINSLLDAIHQRPAVTLPELWNIRLLSVATSGVVTPQMPIPQHAHLRHAQPASKIARYEGSVTTDDGHDWETVVTAPEQRGQAWLEVRARDSEVVRRVPLHKMFGASMGRPAPGESPALLSWTRSDGSVLSSGDLAAASFFERVEITGSRSAVYYSPELGIALHDRGSNMHARSLVSDGTRRVAVQWKYEHGGIANRLIVADAPRAADRETHFDPVWAALAHVPALLEASTATSAAHADAMQSLYRGLREQGEHVRYLTHPSLALQALVGAIEVVKFIDEQGVRETACNDEYDIARPHDNATACTAQSMHDDWEHNELKHQLASLANAYYSGLVRKVDAATRNRYRTYLESVLHAWGHPKRPFIHVPRFVPRFEPSMVGGGIQLM